MPIQGYAYYTSLLHIKYGNENKDYFWNKLIHCSQWQWHSWVWESGPHLWTKVSTFGAL